MIDWQDPAYTFRKSILSRLAGFASAKFHSEIWNGGCNGAVDLADIVDGWDSGTNDDRIHAADFTEAERAALGGFQEAFDRFCILYPDPAAETRENDFFYKDTVSPPEPWQELEAQANYALRAFQDFDLTDWERSGFPVWA